MSGSYEHSPVIERESSNKTWAVAFSANGEHLLSAHYDVVQARQVDSGVQTASMRLGASKINCLAVSQDGRWIVAGTKKGAFVWNAETYDPVLTVEDEDVVGVDVSPDSTQLLVASDTGPGTATVWDIATRERVLAPLHHDNQWLRAAKYSPQGDQIATAASYSIRIWDSDSGGLRVKIPVTVTPWYNTGLLWFNDHLFAISKNTIKQIKASTGSVISRWPVADTSDTSSIVLPLHREFIAYSTNRTVMFWDISTHTQLGIIEHNQEVCSIALSPDDQFLAIGGKSGDIDVKCLSHITDSIPLSRLHPTLQEPDFHIDDAALTSWKRDELTNAEELLTAAIPTPLNPDHHILASRALVRARLQQWGAAMADAKESIKIQPSAIGYIAKSIVLIGEGKKRQAYRACDIAFEHFHSNHITFLLLIKAIIVFMAGEHDDAILRLDDLIATVRFNAICYVVQAKMYLLFGNSQIEQCNYEGAIRSYERARANMRHHTDRSLLAISLISGWKFDELSITIRKRLCEALCAAGRAKDAGVCLLEMLNVFDERLYMSQPITEWISHIAHRILSMPESSDTTWRATTYHGAPTLHAHAERAEWVFDFKRHCSMKLKDRGDAAMNAERSDDAISHYSAALSLDPAAPGLFLERSKAYFAKGLLQEALDDANKVIELDPLSPWGYERKHVALHQAEDYENAIAAFKVMLSKISHSPDPKIRELHCKYVNPDATKVTIQRVIRNAIRDSPRVLINTFSGRLCDKSEQAAAFKSLPIFNKLISSMTTGIDHSRIERDVTQYYRYAMLSHRWEADEPRFEKVAHTVVYDLGTTPTHHKLKMFCKIVRDDDGLYWAWSDTCCINQADHNALKEALVAMFRWYQGSTVTIIFLYGVRFPSQRGDLMRSIWNTRAWTLQEYHASKVVRFYNEDWMLYLNLDIPNHKDSLEIISEMEEATGVSAQTLMRLLPGTTNIREKLRLASTRQTSRVEDAAYSLLGIFSMTMSVVYGEGNRSLGRLLARLLTNSGDTSILAWTGRSGDFNSCLPAEISVFEKQSITHIPQAMEDVQMARVTARLRVSSLNSTSVMELYDRLNMLQVPTFAEQRMKLPCIIFKLERLRPLRGRSDRIFQAQSSALGTVKIQIREDISRFASLCLVHPWIDFLLDRQPVITEMALEDSTDSQYSVINQPPGPSNVAPPTRKIRPANFFARLGHQFRTWPQSSHKTSYRPPSPMPSTDKQMQALQLIARLRQPFGALLLAQTRKNVREYRRVAAESLFEVQVREDMPLNELLDSVDTLDVL